MRELLLRWRDEKAGLTMIVASVAVIAVIIALLFHIQHSKKVEELSLYGSGVVQLMAQTPIGQLADAGNLNGPLHVLRQSQETGRFAYAAVLDDSGRLLNQVNAPTVVVAPDMYPAETPSWLGNRTARLADGTGVVEYFSPIVTDGNLAGTLRIGYFEPSYGLSMKQLPLLGMIALPIFLLTPLFHLLMRRELKPIQVANRELTDLVSDGRIKDLDLETSGELQGFISKFGDLVKTMHDRMEVLEKDNTKMVTSQKLLTYRKMRIEAVLQALPDAVIVLGDDGCVTYANDKVESMLGVKPADIVGRPPSAWCTNDDVTKFMTRFETTETSRLFSDTMRIKSVTSPQKKLSVKAYPLYAPQAPESIAGRLVVIRDASKDVLAEEHRANFVAHVVHELKSPLNTLNLYSEALLGEDGKKESFRVEAVNVIRDETERLAALVGNLLNITKIEMGSLKIEKTRVRPKDLLSDAFNQFSHHGKGKDIEFVLDLPGEMSALVADKELLRVALNNLLSNAVKYSRKEDTVTLSATESEETVEIRIADTGIGIEPQFREKIFEKFYRAESAEVDRIGGHGLGLPLAKEIIELHRGTLSVESEPGKGSVFTIILWKDSGLLQKAI